MNTRSVSCHDISNNGTSILYDIVETQSFALFGSDCTDSGQLVFASMSCPRVHIPFWNCMKSGYCNSYYDVRVICGSSCTCNLYLASLKFESENRISDIAHKIGILVIFGIGERDCDWTEIEQFSSHPILDGDSLMTDFDLIFAKRVLKFELEKSCGLSEHVVDVVIKHHIIVSQAIDIGFLARYNLFNATLVTDPSSLGIDSNTDDKNTENLLNCYDFDTCACGYHNVLNE